MVSGHAEPREADCAASFGPGLAILPLREVAARGDAIGLAEGVLDGLTEAPAVERDPEGQGFDRPHAVGDFVFHPAGLWSFAGKRGDDEDVVEGCEMRTSGGSVSRIVCGSWV